MRFGFYVYMFIYFKESLNFFFFQKEGGCLVLIFLRKEGYKVQVYLEFIFFCDLKFYKGDRISYN